MHPQQPDTPVGSAELVVPSLFTTLAGSIDMGLVLINSEYHVCFINAIAEQLLNIDADKALGQGLVTLTRDHSIDSMMHEVMQDGEQRDVTLQLSAENRILSLRLTAIASSSGFHGLLLLVNDITQKSLLERARRDLMANVSHELRTPLASLKLLVETVQSRPPDNVMDRMLAHMAYEIDAVTELVEELHELSQLESGRITLQLSANDMRESIAQALNRIRPQADRKALQIEANWPKDMPLVLMDEHRIGQVLLNLLQNAIEFTPEGGQIQVELRIISIEDQHVSRGYVQGLQSAEGTRPIAAPGSDATSATVLSSDADRTSIVLPVPHAIGTWMMVSIRDTGVGIPSQDLPRIFERFYRVDRSRNRTTGGTGLGLAIARHLIEGHGGRIWATSEEGHGSTFYFTLLLA